MTTGGGAEAVGANGSADLRWLERQDRGGEGIGKEVELLHRIEEPGAVLVPKLVVAGGQARVPASLRLPSRPVQIPTEPTPMRRFAVATEPQLRILWTGAGECAK